MSSLHARAPCSLLLAPTRSCSLLFALADDESRLGKAFQNVARFDLVKFPFADKHVNRKVEKS